MAARKRRIGKNGPEVLPIGLGCMSLSGVYGPSDEAAGIAFIQRAVDLGVDHLDSSDMYGWGQNESLLGRALQGSRINYTMIKNILEAGLDKQPSRLEDRPLPSHDNIRGKDHYQ